MRLRSRRNLASGSPTQKTASRASRARRRSLLSRTEKSTPRKVTVGPYHKHTVDVSLFWLHVGGDARRVGGLVATEELAKKLAKELTLVQTQWRKAAICLNTTTNELG